MRGLAPEFSNGKTRKIPCPVVGGVRELCAACAAEATTSASKNTKSTKIRRMITKIVTDRDEDTRLEWKEMLFGLKAAVCPAGL
jgi:hypothetical protein